LLFLKGRDVTNIFLLLNGECNNISPPLMENILNTFFSLLPIRVSTQTGDGKHQPFPSLDGKHKLFPSLDGRGIRGG
jgi:hypothetical protein